MDSKIESSYDTFWAHIRHLLRQLPIRSLIPRIWVLLVHLLIMLINWLHSLCFPSRLPLGRESPRNVIAGFCVRQHFQPGQQLTFDTYRGTVGSTTGAYTVLEVTAETGEQHTIALRNALLLRRAVLSQELPPATTPQPEEEASS